MLRPLSTVEHVFWLACRSVSNHIVYAAEIAGTPTPQAWRAAFDSVQRRHPALSVRISATPDGWPFFETVHGSSIPLHHAGDATWSAEGVAHEWLHETLSRELLEPLDNATAPLMRAVIATGKDRSVVVVTVSHVIYDGISVTCWFDDLLRVLNGEPLDALSFPQSLNHLLGVPDAVPPQKKISLDGVSYPQASPPVVRCKRLSHALTRQLVQRARDESTTVHGALCSAFVMSGKSRLAHWRREPILLRNPVDLRRRWGSRYECGFFATSTNATLDPDAELSFWDLAREILRRMDPQGTRESAGEGVRQYSDLLSSGMDAKGLVQMSRAGKTPDLGITNVGVVRDTAPLARFRLTGLWGPLVRASIPGYLAVAVSSVDGRIHLTMMNHTPLPTFLDDAEVLLEKACAPRNFF